MGVKNCLRLHGPQLPFLDLPPPSFFNEGYTFMERDEAGPPRSDGSHEFAMVSTLPIATPIYWHIPRCRLIVRSFSDIGARFTGETVTTYNPCHVEATPCIAQPTLGDRDDCSPTAISFNKWSRNVNAHLLKDQGTRGSVFSQVILAVADEQRSLVASGRRVGELRSCLNGMMRPHCDDVTLPEIFGTETNNSR
jgi:hypothetical protein